MRTTIFLTHGAPTVDRVGMANYTIEMGDLTLMVAGGTDAEQLMFLRRLRTACDAAIRDAEESPSGAEIAVAAIIADAMNEVRR